MSFTPTPITAALAGAFSALALPALSPWLGQGADGSVGYIVAFLLLVALPAHAGVLGLRRPAAAPSRSIDKPLLLRIAAWLGAALAVALVSWALRR